MNKRKYIIIGPDSYLFNGLAPYLQGSEVHYMTFENWKDAANLKLLKEADAVINFTIHPDFSAKEMELQDIIDIQIGEHIKGGKTLFVFLSSRRVYGTSAEYKVYKETDALAGADFYSVNKIKTEKELSGLLGGNLCVMRVSNVIGEPVNKSGYKTFAGWISENYIKNGKIVTDQASETKKDFISKDFLHKTIAAIANNSINGVFNVSAGFPITIKDLLTNMAGKENVIFCENCPVKEQFVLDNSKIVSKTGISIKEEDVITAAKAFNKALVRIKKTSGERQC